MGVKIRLQRTGRHKDPHFRVVAVDSRKRRDGKVLEYIGHYHPQEEVPNAIINLEKVDYWIEKGAQMSSTVKSLVSRLRKVTDKEE